MHALCLRQNAAARTHYPPTAENAVDEARLYASVLREAHNAARRFDVVSPVGEVSRSDREVDRQNADGVHCLIFFKQGF